ncbi:MAG: hypothetical protein IKX06_04385 [Clostridia bacterium]|nr:hypothetical protein [Clostridia bacterium]
MNYYFGGRYQGKLIADGGASGAKLVKGRKRATGEAVAIKIWRAGAPEGLRECRLWERDGRGYFMEAGPDGDRLLLVRKWIPGEDLARIVEKNGVLSARKTLELLSMIASELRLFYETLGSCFGDLKPENIILDGDKVSLIDLESCEEPSSMSPPGGRRTLRLLTVGFSAPEMAWGRPEQASDFYSLAMTGVFLMTGKTDPEQLKCADRGLADFILKNLSALPSERCGSIDEIEEALRRIKGGSPPFGPSCDDGSPEENTFAPKDQSESMCDKPALTEDAGKGSGNGGINGSISVENMNVKASRIIFSRDSSETEDTAEPPGTEDPSGYKKNGRSADKGDDGAAEGSMSVSENGISFAPAGSDRAFGGPGESGPSRGRASNRLLGDEYPEDRGIPFPHVEKGFRRLVVYVPDNIMLASELAYVLASCFGFRTLLCEITDCTEPRIKYYYGSTDRVRSEGPGPCGSDAGTPDTGIRSRETPEDALTHRDSADDATCSVASDRGRVYGASEKEIFRAGVPSDDETGAFGFAISGGSLCRDLYSGTLRINPGTVYHDDYILDFVSSSYTNYDMTVVCDGTFESPETRNKLLRFCDFIVAPVDGDADEIGRTLLHYLWILRSQRISAVKLKIVGWEYEENTDADVKLLTESDGRSRHLGNISFDSRRHRDKNHTGEFYCGRMPRKIIREYVSVAGLLTYGEDVCA